MTSRDQPEGTRDPELGPPEVTDAWVGSILDRLCPENHERLLDFDREELRALDHTLRTGARSIVYELEMPEDERRRALSSDRSTASLAFELPGRHACAAAWYAVMHDRLGPGSSVALRSFLRLQVGFSLHQLNDDPKIAEQCVGVLLPLAETPKALSAMSESAETTSELCFTLYETLGFRLGQLGDNDQAVRFLELAADTAPSIDLRIGAVCSALFCLESAGEIQSAYRRLQAERPRIAEVIDPEVKELWHTCEMSLQQRLGVRDLNPGEAMPALRVPIWMIGDWLRQDRKPAATDLERLRGEFESMAEEEARDAPEEIRGLHSLLLGRLRTIDPRKEPDSFEATLRRAEDLERHIDAEEPRLHRRLLAVRLLLARGEHSSAATAYEALWPEAQKLLDPSEQLDLVSQHLLALAYDRPYGHRDRILDLVSFVEQLMPLVITAGQTAVARARTRDLNQRSIEAAFLALVAAYDDGGHSLLKLLPGTSQNERWAAGREGLLARAEGLIVAMRNPELRWRKSMLPPEAEAEHRALEEAFHRCLRANRLGNGKDSEVRNALRRLLEFEITWLTPADTQPVQALDAREDSSLRLYFFELRDLLESPRLLVLRSSPEGRRAHLAPLGPEQRSFLADWQLALHSKTIPFQAQPGSNEEPAREVTRSLLGDDEPSPSIELSLDAAWHELSIEMLPDPWQSGKRLGATHALRIRLRPGFGDPKSSIEWERGWLGVGGAPAAGDMPYLAESLREVESIGTTLGARGIPTSVLGGKLAHRSGLLEGLAARPAVLHLSAHGLAHRIDPDRSALLLAPDPKHSDSELFTFRQILDLEASGLDLVVLSACSSLIGRRNRSGGLQGLAWAFLRAGARAVIASRYPVRDVGARELMNVLYQHLLVEPPAEALRLARADLLDAGANPAEVGAWALWT